MTQPKNIAIGADIGGSHIYCAAIDLTTHRLLPGSGYSEAIDNKAGAPEILDGWAKALHNTLSGFDVSQIAGIGFAMPGPFDYANGIGRFKGVDKFESLYGVNVSESLRTRLHFSADVAFRYINDATAFAIAEAWVGKASAYHNVLALTLGTGFGSAFIHNGIPVTEGETVPQFGGVWHLPYKDATADDYFSTRWFLKNYLLKTGKTVAGVKEISDAAQSEPAARDLFVEYGSGMGHFLAPWIRKFNAGVIVIGGNITGAFNLFGEHLSGALADENLKVNVLLSELREDAAVLGGARLIAPDYWPQVKDLLPNM